MTEESSFHSARSSASPPASDDPRLAAGFELPLALSLSWMWPVISSLSRVCGVAAIVLVSMGLATALIHRRGSLCAVCIRRALLAVVQPLVVVALVPFTRLLPRVLATIGVWGCWIVPVTAS